MFQLSREDHARIIQAVRNILECSDKDKVFVNFYDLCKHLGVNVRNSGKQLLIDEIRDILTCHPIVDSFGLWQFSEYDGQIYVFMQIWKASDSGDLNELLNSGSVAAYSFDPNWPRRGKVGRKNIVLKNVYDLPAEKGEPVVQ